jgi:hypothetical protein
MFICNISTLPSAGLPRSMPARFNHYSPDPSHSSLSIASASIVHWISITPGLPSFGFHLLSNHRSLFTATSSSASPLLRRRISATP